MKYLTDAEKTNLVNDLCRPTNEVPESAIRQIFGKDSSGELACELKRKRPDIYQRLHELRAVPLGLVPSNGKPVPPDTRSSQKKFHTWEEIKQGAERIMDEYAASQKRQW